MSNHKSRLRNSVEIAPFDDVAFLEAGIDRGAADVRLYCMLAECCRTCEVICAVCRFARQAQNQVRRMRGAFFVLTGQTHRPRPTCPFICTCLDTLRQLCLEECRASQCFLEHAACTKNPCLAELYEEIGREKACTAVELERLIGTLLC